MNLVRKSVDEILKKINRSNVRIVAVSKTKPIEAIMEVYEMGQRHFGENYIVEIAEKAPKCPDDIKWHFIGHLQTNKAKQLLQIPNLFVVETVDREKLANTLNKLIEELKREPLNIFIQVNTSNEEQKGGILPKELPKLVQFVLEKCPNLKLTGLMTIGSTESSHKEGKNPDFEVLVECKEKIEKEFSLKDLELSMGMSSDYLQAIEQGSTNIRVGSLIFGERNKK